MAARTCRLSNDTVWLSYPGEHKQLGVFFLLNRTQVKRILLAGCLAAALTVALAACARDKTPSASQGGNPVNSSSSAGDQEDEATETITGTVNRLDEEMDLLLLIADDQYCRFDLNGADVSGLEPGDTVTVIYTGTLDPESEDVTAVVVSVEKSA